MSSVKGTFQNGVARPLEPVSEAHEGQEVIITFVDEPSQAASADKGADARGRRMADALENLASINALSEISNPSAWQREERQERRLPDRDV